MVILKIQKSVISLFKIVPDKYVYMHKKAGKIKDKIKS